MKNENKVKKIKIIEDKTTLKKVNFNINDKLHNKIAINLHVKHVSIMHLSHGLNKKTFQQAIVHALSLITTSNHASYVSIEHLFYHLVVEAFPINREDGHWSLIANVLDNEQLNKMRVQMRKIKIA